MGHVFFADGAKLGGHETPTPDNRTLCSYVLIRILVNENKSNSKYCQYTFWNIAGFGDVDGPVW